MTEIYEYLVINLSLEPKPAPDAATNRWGAMGWRTVSFIPAKGSAYADAILIERKKEVGSLEENVRQHQARMIAKEIREEFPPSDIPDYIEREFGGRE